MTEPTPLSDPDNLWLEVEPEDTDGLTDAEYDVIFGRPGGVTDEVRAALSASDVSPLIEPETLLAAADVAEGAMVALVPSDADLGRLAVDGGEPREQLHLTLAYLGDAADWTPEQRDEVILRLKNVVQDADLRAVTGRAFGINWWNGDTDSASWNLAISGSDLEHAHDLVWDVLTEDNSSTLLPEPPEQHAPWVPHICLAYSHGGEVWDWEALTQLVGEDVTFDRLRVAFGGEVTDVPLVSFDGLGAAAGSHDPGSRGTIPGNVTHALEEVARRALGGRQGGRHLR